MNELKAYGYIFLGMIGCFMIGTYAFSVMYDVKEVEWYRWFITSFFTLAFINMGIHKLKNL